MGDGRRLMCKWVVVSGWGWYVLWKLWGFDVEKAYVLDASVKLSLILSDNVPSDESRLND